MEANILMTLGFDFNFPGPIQSLERYLRILEYDLNRTIFDMSYQICKFSLNDANFLKYESSKIAISSLLLAINIYEWDFEKKGKSQKGFFKNCKMSNNLVQLNLQIWNREYIHQLTGYAVEDIKECLYDLSMFIANSLSPNRLANFDIELIKEERNYYR